MLFFTSTLLHGLDFNEVEGIKIKTIKLKDLCKKSTHEKEFETIPDDSSHSTEASSGSASSQNSESTLFHGTELINKFFAPAFMNHLNKIHERVFDLYKELKTAYNDEKLYTSLWQKRDLLLRTDKTAHESLSHGLNFLSNRYIGEIQEVEIETYMYDMMQPVFQGWLQTTSTLNRLRSDAAQKLWENVVQLWEEDVLPELARELRDDLLWQYDGKHEDNVEDLVHLKRSLVKDFKDPKLLAGRVNEWMKEIRKHTTSLKETDELARQLRQRDVIPFPNPKVKIAPIKTKEELRQFRKNYFFNDDRYLKINKYRMILDIFENEVTMDKIKKCFLSVFFHCIEQLKLKLNVKVSFVLSFDNMKNSLGNMKDSNRTTKLKEILRMTASFENYLENPHLIPDLMESKELWDTYMQSAVRDPDWTVLSV